MENIGAKLKDKRQDKKLSIDEVSKRTKIQKHILEALEQDKAEGILGAVYAKSFLKKYALFLGLKLPEALKQSLAFGESAAPLLTLAEKKKGKSFNWQKLLPLIKIAVIILIIIVSAAILVKTVRVVHHNLTAAKKKPTPTPASVRQVKKTTPAPSATPSSAKITPSRLLLKTKKDVWVQVKADNRIVFEGFLKRASQEEWAFEREMHLWVGNAAFVELTLNGKYYGSPGKGVIRDIIVTKEGIKIK